MRIEDALSATVEWKVALIDAQHLDELGYLSGGELAAARIAGVLVEELWRIDPPTLRQLSEAVETYTEHVWETSRRTRALGAWASVFQEEHATETHVGSMIVHETVKPPPVTREERDQIEEELAKQERVQAVKHAITKALKFTDNPEVEQALTEALQLVNKQ